MVFKRLGDFLEKSFEHLPNDGIPAMTFTESNDTNVDKVAPVGNGNENNGSGNGNGNGNGNKATTNTIEIEGSREEFDANFGEEVNINQIEILQNMIDFEHNR